MRFVQSAAVTVKGRSRDARAKGDRAHAIVASNLASPEHRHGGHCRARSRAQPSAAARRRPAFSAISASQPSHAARGRLASSWRRRPAPNAACRRFPAARNRGTCATRDNPARYPDPARYRFAAAPDGPAGDRGFRPWSDDNPCNCRHRLMMVGSLSRARVRGTLTRTSEADSAPYDNMMSGESLPCATENDSYFNSLALAYESAAKRLTLRAPRSLDRWHSQRGSANNRHGVLIRRPGPVVGDPYQSLWLRSTQERLE